MTDVTIHPTPVVGTRMDEIGSGTWFVLEPHATTPLYIRTAETENGSEFMCVETNGATVKFLAHVVVYPVSSIDIEVTH
jgi:hypothetical protein